MTVANSAEVPAFWGWFNYFVETVKAAAFRSGLELAIWGKVAEGYDTAEALAAHEGWEVEGVRRLLNMLVSLGLLTKEVDTYLLVSEADWYLVPGKPTYMGDFLLYMMSWEGGHQLSAAIRTGKRPIAQDILHTDMEKAFGEFFTYHRLTPEQSVQQAAQAWDGLGITVQDGWHVLDFACGSAVAPLALCRLHPGVKTTLQDHPHVLSIAQEIAESLGLASQIEYLPGDMRTVDFGVNRFDMARVHNALFYMGPDAICDVLSRVRVALKSEGIFVTEDTMADDQITKDSYPPVDALWLYAITEQGNAYTFSEWQGFLEQAGFINVTRIGSRIRAEAPILVKTEVVMKKRPFASEDANATGDRPTRRK